MLLIMKDGKKMQNKSYTEILDTYAHYQYCCFVCGKRANQLAHIITNSKSNRKEYSAKIIDSKLNVLPACSLECNALIDTGKNTLLKNNIERYIRTGNRSQIEQLVRDNIARKKERLCKHDDV